MRFILKKEKDVFLYCDLNNVLKFKGEKFSVYKFDLFLSKVLLFFSFLLFIFFLIFYSSNNYFFSGVLISCSIYIFLYSFFLRRDRNIFDDRLIINKYLFDLVNLDYVKINIADYFSFELSCLIDKNFGNTSTSVYFTDQKKLFLFLVDIILYKENISILSKRLGIDNTKELIQFLKEKKFDIFKDFLFEKFLLNLYKVSTDLLFEKINPTCVLIVFLEDYLYKFLSKYEITREFIEGTKLWLKSQNYKNLYLRQLKIFYRRKPKGKMNSDLTSVGTPTINKFGKDLPELKSLRENLLIGRDDVIEIVQRNLQSTSQSYVLLIGHEGIGKTSILNFLALKIVLDKNFMNFYQNDYRVVLINLNDLFLQLDSNEKLFYANINQILKEANNKNNVVLFLENIDQVFTFNIDLKNEIINLFVNSSEQNKNKIIATSSYNNYVKYIKPQKNILSIFEEIFIPEPDNLTTFQILADRALYLEKKYNVTITFSAIKRIIDLKDKYDFDLVMPLKGIKFLEESILHSISLKNYKIDRNDVDEVISSKTGIKIGFISQDESTKILNLENEIRKRFVGQDHAVVEVCSAIKRSRSGIIENKKRPISSFLFYGPTGVGKTELTKTLAEVYYGDEKNILRLDMSEFQEERNIERIIGGVDINGNFFNGYLVEGIRKNPFTVVLLDEIEKANKKVLDLFLQVLDEGFITDALGNKADFTNSIIIATSNVGSDIISENHDIEYVELEKMILAELKKFFRIEFLNRFDKLIMFRHLNIKEIIQVIQIQMNKLKNFLKNKGIILEWDIDTLIYLSKLSYNKTYGAREVRRVLQEKIEDTISELIILNKLSAGNKIVFNKDQYEIVSV